MSIRAATPVPGTSDDTPLPGDTVTDAAARMLAMFGADDEPSADTPATPDSDAEADDAAEPAPDDEGASSDDTASPDADQAPAEDTTPPSDGLYDVVVDGETIRVPLDELVKGYSRQADYTRKTQQTAAEAKQLAEARALYDQKLAAVEAILSESQQEPDWAALRENSTPEEFADTYAQWSIQKANRDKVQAERARVRAEQEAEQQKAMAAIRDREADLLLRKIPAWKDDAVRTAESKKLVQYAETTLGVSAHELAGVMDHRMIVALHKAMRYDEMAGKAKTAKAAPAPTSPSVKPATPTAAPTPPETSTKRNRDLLLERQRRSGSVNDTAAIFFDMLD